MTALHRALLHMNADALRAIAAAESAPGLPGMKPPPSLIARIALPLLDCYEGRSGDSQALRAAVAEYARQSGAQVYLDTNDALTLTVPGSRDFEQGQVLPVLSGAAKTSDLRDFLNFYPWDLRCARAIESLCGWTS